MSLRGLSPSPFSPPASPPPASSACVVDTGRRTRRASFLIPANDGYGVADCLAHGRGLRRIVANAWCEAHGLGKAAQFGPVDPADVTASVQTTSQTRPRRPSRSPAASEPSACRNDEGGRGPL